MVRKLDDERFGSLRVLRRDGSRNNRALWLCKCDCGGETHATSDVLLRGVKVSCGCAQHQPKREDLKGLEVGLLTVDEPLGYEKGVMWWWCDCECGKRVKIRAQRLKAGLTKSCGCYRKRKASMTVEEKKNFNLDFTPLPKKDIRKPDHRMVASKLERMEGMIYERHLVIELVSTCPTVWLCLCECGKEKRVRAQHLKEGESQSCGCLQKERVSESNTTHGGSSLPEYAIWQGMKRRCYSEDEHAYKKYGGRGIFVCERWKDSFDNFYDDMGPRPTEKHSVERKDNDGPYAPTNCEWADRITQANNKSNNVFLAWDEREQTIANWARELGLTCGCIIQRLRHGWTIERALTTPGGQKRGTEPIKYSSSEEAQKAKSRRALYMACRTGQITRPARCSKEGCEATEVQGHHHNGYDDEHALDVVWYCARHHPRENSITHTALGVTLSVSEWSERTGLKKATIIGRINRGLPADEVVTRPLKGT